MLLLHGFGSSPETWEKFINDRFKGSYSVLDYEEGDVINSEPTPDKKGILCYAVKFGSWDTASGLTNVEGETATESSSGDYSTFEQMGREVQYAIEGILNKYSQTNVEILLLGHSRGGLVARKFLQDLATSKEKAHIMGLLTTSTPHKGTPIGRIYSYLSEHSRDSCEDTPCKRDWAVIDLLNGRFLKIVGKSIDGCRPTVNDLSDNSGAIEDLNSNISQLPSNIAYGEILNSGSNLGVVFDSSYKGHSLRLSLLESLKSSIFKNRILLSKNARNYILCGDETNCDNKPEDFPGDGLVPVDNQGYIFIDGFPSGAKAKAKRLSSSSNVLHTGATSQEADISNILTFMLSEW